MAIPKHIQENLAKILTDIGLPSSEIDVFIYLFQSDDAERISSIARRTKLNRTTLYGILKSLSARGLVSSIDDGGILTYRSIQPRALVDYVERAKEKLVADITHMTELVPFMDQLRKSGGRKYPTIQFFDGREGIKQAYEDTIKGNPSKKIYGFTGTEAIYAGIDADWINSYIRRRTLADVKWYSIATDSPIARATKLRDSDECRVTKILPRGYRSSLELCTYGDKVMIASFSQDHPLGIIIEDREIAETIKTLFTYIDSTLPE